MSSKFDISTAKEQFPALKSGQVFFDNAGGSQILWSVVESIQKYLLETNVQLGASYPIGKRSTSAFKAGYEASAKFINASVDEIISGPSTTQLFRNLSYTLTFPPGSELIISKLDHEANIAPWVDLAKRHDLIIKWWSPPPSTNPKLTPENLKPLLGEKTKLVALTHASNILGTIHDIKAISKLVHTIPGAMICVDSVAYAPHRQVDVQELEVDFYCFSWYKVFGPHCSLLYASTQAQKNLGSLGHYFNPSGTLSEKLTLGSYHYELTASIPAVLKYLSPADNLSETYKIIADHEAKLASILLEYLNSKSNITVYGEPTPDASKRVPTISWTVNGWKSSDVVTEVEKLSDGKFGFRCGTFYSVRLSEDVLGLDKEGVVRVSMVHYNTVDEIESFVKILDAVVSKK